MDQLENHPLQHDENQQPQQVFEPEFVLVEGQPPLKCDEHQTQQLIEPEPMLVEGQPPLQPDTVALDSFSEMDDDELDTQPPLHLLEPECLLVESRNLSRSDEVGEVLIQVFTEPLLKNIWRRHMMEMMTIIPGSKESTESRRAVNYSDSK